VSRHGPDMVQTCLFLRSLSRFAAVLAFTGSCV
jgi:hypothetical protein